MRKISQFIIVGAIGTGLHYTILYMLVATELLEPGYAAMVGATFGALFNYLINKKYTFGNSAPHHVALPKYIVMSIFSVIITGIIVSGSTRLEHHYIFGQLLATVVTLIFNFMISSKFIFHK